MNSEVELKYFIRVNYVIEQTMIMKTYRIPKNLVEKLHDGIEQFIYDRICNDKNTDKIELVMMILCDENDNIIKSII